MITMLPTNMIINHENNPRKNLGDLTELSDSIKANGILQPLTVVPCNGMYKVIIGHRRLAAAMQAELEEVPCEIKELSDDAQLNVMMMENMLRENLTTYEEAKGFQMMLDLGKSVEQVAKETGFSNTTIRNRTKLLGLDEAKFKKSVERGATLSDLIELDKIDDEHTRNAVLTHAGTPEFRSKLNQAIEAQLKAKAWADALMDINKWAKHIDNLGVVDGETKPMHFIDSWWYGKNKPLVCPGEGTFYYTNDAYCIRVYTDGEDTAEAERKQKRDEQNRIEAELSDVAKSCYDLRLNYLKNFKAIKKHGSLILHEFMKLALTDRMRSCWRSAGNLEAASAILGCELNLDNLDMLDDFPVERVALAYIAADCDKPDACSWRRSWNNGEFSFIYEENEKLLNYYAFLIRIGYQPSEEEKNMMDGNVKYVIKEEAA